MTKKELTEKTDILRKKMELASAWTDDADALECVELFPYWVPGRDYIVGERIQYNKVLYKCIQAHTSQEDWHPDITPALWVEVTFDPFPPFKKPDGAADAYMKGNGVTFEDKHYICQIDYTVHSPAEYPPAWEEVE